MTLNYVNGIDYTFLYLVSKESNTFFEYFCHVIGKGSKRPEADVRSTALGDEDGGGGGWDDNGGDDESLTARSTLIICTGHWPLGANVRLRRTSRAS